MPGGPAVQRAEPLAQAGHLDDPDQVRHLLHLPDRQPGRRAADRLRERRHRRSRRRAASRWARASRRSSSRSRPRCSTSTSSLIQPVETATEVVPNASSTGASTGADLNGGAVKLAAEDLKARLQQWCIANQNNPAYQPFPDWQNDWSGSWKQIVAYAYDDRQDLSAQALYASPGLSEVAADPEHEHDAFLLLLLVGRLLRGGDRRPHRRVHDPPLGHPVRRGQEPELAPRRRPDLGRLRPGNRQRDDRGAATTPTTGSRSRTARGTTSRPARRRSPSSSTSRCSTTRRRARSPICRSTRTGSSRRNRQASRRSSSPTPSSSRSSTPFRRRARTRASTGGSSFRPRRPSSRSSSRARHARPRSVTLPDRLGHLPLHRYRRVDPPARGARRRAGRVRWPTTTVCCAKPSPPSGDTRSTGRATRSSSCSSRPRTPSARLARCRPRSPGTIGPAAPTSASGWEFTPASVMLGPEGYVGVDVHRGGSDLRCGARRPGPALPGDLGAARRRRGARPRRAPAEGPDEARAALPARSAQGSSQTSRRRDRWTRPTCPCSTRRLIDREEEVASTVALIRDEAAKLVTLTGPGGTGKTRVALQTAAELVGAYRDGVFFVPLAPVANAADVESVVALAIGAPVEGNGLVRFVRDRELLLILDNFEHLLDGAPLVAQLLSRVAGSACAGHEPRPAAPLGRARAARAAARRPSTPSRCSTERARSARPDFEPDEAAVQLCARPRGHAARDRARRCPAEAPDRGRAARAPQPLARPAERRRPGPARAAADAAGDDRVELPAARTGRAARCSSDCPSSRAAGRSSRPRQSAGSPQSTDPTSSTGSRRSSTRASSTGPPRPVRSRATSCT